MPGPGATKWHATCLVCGGKNRSKRASASWITREEPKGPGCSKKLDSAAKGDATEGILWCRDCWEVVRLGQMPESPSAMASPTSASGAPSMSSPFIASRPSSSLGLSQSTTFARQMSRSGATSPIRRSVAFPHSGAAPISEDDVLTDLADGGGGATQYLGGRITPGALKPDFTGVASSRALGPVRPQFTGTGFRSTSPVRRQMTGAGSEGAEIEPLAIQFTGGGVPVTRQLTTAGRRPKSALGTNRSYGSNKSIDGGRGMFLVRQMTGQQGSPSPTASGAAAVSGTS